MPGRITLADEGRALVAADVALGAGWGGAATFVLGTGSNSQRGSIAITASTTTPAQATSTVTITFPKAFDNVPFGHVTEVNNTQAVPAEPPTEIVLTAASLIFKAGVLPVDTKVYTYSWTVFP